MAIGEIVRHKLGVADIQQQSHLLLQMAGIASTRDFASCQFSTEQPGHGARAKWTSVGHWLCTKYHH